MLVLPAAFDLKLIFALLCIPAPLLLGLAELSTFLTCLSACSAAASAGVADSVAAHTAVTFCICCVNTF